MKSNEFVEVFTRFMKLEASNIFENSNFDKCQESGAAQFLKRIAVNAVALMQMI